MKPRFAGMLAQRGSTREAGTGLASVPYTPRATTGFGDGGCPQDLSLNALRVVSQPKT